MKASNPVIVDIVSDVVCPWCIVGYKQLERAAEQTDVELDIRWHPFELNPRMADEGEDLRAHLAAKYGTTPAGSDKTRAMLGRLGAEVGFTFEFRDGMRIYPTFRAHQLLRWAHSKERGHALKMALFSAYFTLGHSPNDIDALVAIARTAGLDGDEARAILEDGRNADAVRAEERTWIDRGVRGVPAMLFDDRHLMVGARGVEGYAAILRSIVDARSA